MATPLPNPFENFNSTLDPAMGVRAAAAPGSTDPQDAAAEKFPRRFDLTAEIEEKLFSEIEAPPAFLSSPRPEFLKAAEFAPVLEIISGHARRGRTSLLLAAGALG
jgi:hypothetical protein